MLNRSHPTCQIECQCDDFRCYEGEACSVCGRGNIPDGTLRQNFIAKMGFASDVPLQMVRMLALMVIVAMIGLYFFALFAQYFRGLAPRIYKLYGCHCGLCEVRQIGHPKSLPFSGGSVNFILILML